MKQCKVQTLAIIYWWPCTSNDDCEIYSGSECHHFSRKKDLLTQCSMCSAHGRKNYSQIILPTVVANFSQHFKKGFNKHRCDLYGLSL